MALSEYISHDDRTLKEHLEGLKLVIDCLLEEKTQNLYNGQYLRSLLYRLVSYHDLAKASVFFQLYLADSLLIKGTAHNKYSEEDLRLFLDYHKEKLKELRRNPNRKEHAHFGAWAFLSTIDVADRYGLDAMIAMKILKRHHGYLRDFGLGTINPSNCREQFMAIEENIDYWKVKELLDSIDLPFSFPEISKILDGFKLLQFTKLESDLRNNSNPSYYFKAVFTYSLLLSADKGDVMLKDKSFQRIKIGSDIIDQFKLSKLTSEFKINQLREKAYGAAIDNIERFGHQNFFSITLPTGLGKTFTAYKAALMLREKFDEKARVVYCLPFTSIIDQNGSLFKEILIDAGISEDSIGIHHHLAAPEGRSENEENYPTWEYFTEGWQREITITTFVQLWESIFANHNKELRKFHNLVNSIIILDEVQAISPALLPALEFVMESMANFFNTKFILVTATQPIILSEKTKEICFVESNDYFFHQLDRTLLDRSLLLKYHHISEEELAGEVLTEFKKCQKSILIICNTIRYSQNVYEMLFESLGEQFLFYLSASIIPFSREYLLNNQIAPLLKRGKPIILVSTQVIEAGVDVDFNLVFRDFAPLSSINQAAGRCNRNSSTSISRVKLFRSGKEKIYDPTLISITENVLKGNQLEIPENQYFRLNEAYFRGVKQKVQDNSFVSKKLIDSMLRLKFEDVGTNKEYRLIVEKYKSYNYFIPLNEEAFTLWEQYLELMGIDDHFTRKNKLKTHIPKMMKFVIRIPDYIHQPKAEEKEKFLINDGDWNSFYDEVFGYKTQRVESAVETF